MAKKKHITELTVAQPVQMGQPDFSSILSSGLDTKSMRLEILKAEGVQGVRQKYPSKEARIAAYKEKMKDKRAKDRAILEKHGIAPKPRVKRTEEEKAQYRRDYRKKRAGKQHSFLVEMAKKNPELAKKFGIHADKLK
jgi:hypothetical protein